MRVQENPTGGIHPIMAEHKKTVPCAKPFLKWAGGKTQLLDEFSKRLPAGIQDGALTNYVEPFIGGGAFFFYLNKRFSFEQCTIGDANKELILAFRVVRRSIKKLISELGNLESEYFARNEAERELFYYEVRDSFNAELREINFHTYDPEWVRRAAMIIFLNRTCYNGLFRMNRSGEFNVPFGRYKNPDILNKDNLMDVSLLLKNTDTKILSGDFTACRPFVDDRTFVYFDPPYRPLNQTSSFTSYSKNGFSEIDQIRLAKFFKELDARGASIMLSNSDPRNQDSCDTFFDDLFEGYTIDRVPARRLINSNGSRRGNIDELIITNY
jgi:DNA adenine methylase